jgi:hypothetical protein
MNATDPEPPPPASGTLDLIDAAVAAARCAAHACGNQTAREHHEYALALLTEAWIAESGRQARSAGKVIGDVRSALALFAALAPRQPASSSTLQPSSL